MAKALSGDDPFFDYRYNILKNVPGYTDQAKLDKFERFTTAAAAVELELNPVRGSFDRAHLQQIHKRLFEEVYPWAGEPRPTDLRRPGFSWFVRKEFLGITLDNTLSALAAEKHWKGLNEETFSARAAHFLGDLNHIHFFREGNGRTQREFVRELAAEAGYRLNWSRVKPELMNEASIQSHEHRDNSGLIAVIRSSIEPPKVFRLLQNQVAGRHATGKIWRRRRICSFDQPEKISTTCRSAREFCKTEDSPQGGRWRKAISTSRLRQARINFLFSTGVYCRRTLS